jgi:hypothetical protein
MATWDSIVDFAREEARTTLINGPTSSAPVVDRLLVLLDADELPLIIAERNAIRLCGNLHCGKKVARPADPTVSSNPTSSSGTSPEAGVDFGDYMGVPLRFCCDRCIAQHKRTNDLLPIHPLVKDDPAVVLTVTAMFPHVVTKVGLKPLMEGAKARVVDGELKVEPAEVNRAPATAERRNQDANAAGGKRVTFTMPIHERENPTLQSSIPDPEPIQLPLGPGLRATGSREEDADIGAVVERLMAEGVTGAVPRSGLALDPLASMGEAKKSFVPSRKPQLQALLDFSSFVTDNTRELVDVGLRTASPTELSALFGPLPAVNAALELLNTSSASALQVTTSPAAHSRQWGKPVGLHPIPTTETTLHRQGTVTEGLRQRTQNLQLLLKLSDPDASLIMDTLLRVVLNSFHFPESIHVASPAAWLALLAMMLIVGVLADPKVIRPMIVKRKSKEFNDMLLALGLTSELVHLMLTHI